MFKLRNEITCNTCFNDSSNEESSSLLQLAMSNSIQTTVNSSLQVETLSGDNPVCCNFYFPLKSAFVVRAFSKVGRYLVIQLKRFVSHHNQVIKDIKHVQCTLKISVPVKENEVSYQKYYHLIDQILSIILETKVEVITSFIKIPTSKSWLHCNDAAF